MEKDIILKITEINIKNIDEIQMLSLSYIGDSIYDVMSREYILKYHIGKINHLHKKVSEIVSAKAQAKFMQKLLEDNILNLKEINIYNRAKNQKNNTKAKNASIIEYKLATALEAIFGYLYLEKNIERLEELFNLIIKYYEKTNEK